MLTAVINALEVGSTLDHYRLEAEVARTGMSTLFRATDLRSGGTVAVKVPHPEMETDPVLLERFRREEEIGQEIDHPGVVKTYDGEARSRLYMVIEWVDGRLLRSVLNEKGKLPIGRAVALTVAICEALDNLHKHGVVHRDLKPENIMVLEGDRIKIIDFGIALKEDARRITQTSLTPALGTPDYISPEQVKGQRGDQRSDIYALGAMLYEMLTGQPPFTGANPLVVLNERVLTDPRPARELNPDISAAVAGDPLPRSGARSAASLCDGCRDGVGAGAPGAGGRGRRHAPAEPAQTAGIERRQAGALRGTGADTAGFVRGDAAAGAQVAGLVHASPLRRDAFEQCGGAVKPRALATPQVAGHGGLFIEHLLRPGARFGAAALGGEEVRVVQKSL